MTGTSANGMATVVLLNHWVSHRDSCAKNAAVRLKNPTPISMSHVLVSVAAAPRILHTSTCVCGRGSLPPAAPLASGRADDRRCRGPGHLDHGMPGLSD